jgi:hypothetical protein
MAALCGAKVGDIDHLMIDKVSGRVTYAVMSFGGFEALLSGPLCRPRERRIRNDVRRDHELRLWRWCEVTTHCSGSDVRSDGQNIQQCKLINCLTGVDTVWR